MTNHGDGLIAAAQFAVMLVPAEARLVMARRLIAYFQGVERDSLAALGGVEPQDEALDAEGEAR
jgi:hypothetical protein